MNCYQLLEKNKEIYGLHNSELMGEDSIISLTKRFRESEHLDWLIIGTDYSGNPIGISKEGKVLLQDYDYGELPQFRSVFPCEAILYVEMSFWGSICCYGVFRGFLVLA